MKDYNYYIKKMLEAKDNTERIALIDEIRKEGYD